MRRAGRRGKPRPDLTAGAGEGRPEARSELEPLALTGATAGEAGEFAAVDPVPGDIQLPHRIVALTALTLVATVVLADGYLAAGPAGFIIVGTGLALLAMLTSRAMITAGEEPPRSAVREPRRSGESSQSDFPAYREITSDLYWAGSSRRHYEHGLRPRLARLLDARLAQRHGLDAAADPERARELVGAELWPLVDASRPPSHDSRAPGVSLGTLDRIVTRLEDL